MPTPSQEAGLRLPRVERLIENLTVHDMAGDDHRDMVISCLRERFDSVVARVITSDSVDGS